MGTGVFSVHADAGADAQSTLLDWSWTRSRYHLTISRWSHRLSQANQLNPESRSSHFGLFPANVPLSQLYLNLPQTPGSALGPTLPTYNPTTPAHPVTQSPARLDQSSTFVDLR